MAKTDTISLRVPESLKVKLKKLADSDLRSLNSYIELLLTRHVEKEQGK